MTTSPAALTQRLSEIIGPSDHSTLTRQYPKYKIRGQLILSAEKADRRLPAKIPIPNAVSEAKKVASTGLPPSIASTVRLPPPPTPSHIEIGRDPVIVNQSMGIQSQNDIRTDLSRLR